MSALNLSSATDLERLERRLRSFSQRLEEVEEQIDELGREIGAICGARAGEAKGRRLTLDFRLRVRRCGALPRASRRALRGLVVEPLAGGALATISTAATAIPSCARGPAAPRSACRRPRRPRGAGRGRVQGVEAGDRRLPRLAVPSSCASSLGQAGSGTRRLPPSAGAAQAGASTIASSSPGCQRRRRAPCRCRPGSRAARPARPGRRGRARRWARPSRSTARVSSAPAGVSARVAPEPARVVAHLRLLEQLLRQHQRPTGVADEDRVGGERGGRAQAGRHRGGRA